ncbi:hypothetical protein DOY81_004149, partial [Sarcophaga bullata]
MICNIFLQQNLAVGCLLLQATRMTNEILFKTGLYLKVIKAFL